MTTKILIPLDASDTAQAAAAHAIGLAREHAAAVRFLVVIDFNSFMGSVPNMIEVMSNDARQMLDGWMQSATDAGLQASTAIAETSPEATDIAAVITADAQAWGADLIVFGSHGHSGLYHLLQPSVAAGVERLCAIPVLNVQLGEVPAA